MKEKWIVFDNLHKIMISQEFETEKTAENFVDTLIKQHEERKENYDYNINHVVPRMRYYKCEE